jgi:hypothetical protein
VNDENPFNKNITGEDLSLYTSLLIIIIIMVISSYYEEINASVFWDSNINVHRIVKRF